MWTSLIRASGLRDSRFVDTHDGAQDRYGQDAQTWLPGPEAGEGVGVPEARGATLWLAIPLELPSDLLSKALADPAEAYPAPRVQARHLSTSAQLAELKSHDLDLGLVRERPIGQDLDAMLAVEERLGVPQTRTPLRARSLPPLQGAREAT
ncbi:hypothetical protein [Streptomyces sp. NPDC055134]